MKVFQDIRTAINSWEESNEMLLKLCSIFDCEKSELVETARQWKEEQPITNKAKAIDLIKKLQDTVDHAYDKVSDTSSSVENAQSELEYVDISDANYAVEDVQSDLSTILKGLESDSEKE